MFEIISGNIVEGVEYQITGTGAIVYNSVTVNAGSYFVGVSGVTTYTVDSGSPFVTEASLFKGLSIGLKDDFFLGHFADESYFTGFSIGNDNTLFYFGNYTISESEQNDSNFIPVESKIVVPYLIDEITSVVGNELYNGVTYDRLIELEALHPEITLTIAATNNITQILINGIVILIDINH